MQLITNTQLAKHDCVWCGVVAGEGAHTAACPCGEQYKQVQDMGGVKCIKMPWDEIVRFFND